jgi:YidC/Oxa1 family membrane protein insertase
MDEQKRLLLAVVLSVVVLVGYQTFFVTPPVPNNQPQQVQPQQVQNQNVDQVQEKSQNVSEYKTTTGIVPETVAAQKKNYRTISISTPLYNIAISEQGAAVKSFELKNYNKTNKKDSPLKQLVPEQLTSGTLFFDLEGQSIPGLKDAVYTAKIDTNKTSVFEGKKTIEFILGTSNGIVVKKVFTFKADSYMIDCDIVFQNGSGTSLNIWTLTRMT